MDWRSITKTISRARMCAMKYASAILIMLLATLTYLSVRGDTHVAPATVLGLIVLGIIAGGCVTIAVLTDVARR